MDLSEIQTAILSDPARAQEWAEQLVERLRDAVRLGLDPLRPRQDVPLSKWAEENFYLSKESSYVEKRWTSYPYQRAILDCMGHDAIQEVVFRKSARVGYTKCLLAAVTYFAQHKRRNQVIYQPTDDDADEFVKTELDPVLRDMKIMNTVFPETLRRDKRNTLRQKTFLGSNLHLRGGKAAKNYRRLTVDVAVMDECDGFDKDVEGEGDPRKLISKRVEGATYPKRIFGSTPKVKNLSIIDEAMSEAEMTFRFYVPCPHCQERITLRWAPKDAPYGLRWHDGDPDTAAYLCERCSALFTESEFFAVYDQGRWMTEAGAWIDEGCVFRSPSGDELLVPKSVGFNIWTAYSPQATWPGIVREYLAAEEKEKVGDNSLMKTFINTTLGESWEATGEVTDQNALEERSKVDPYQRGTVPAEALVVHALVDVQGDRFEVSLWGHGREDRMCLVDHLVIEANPAVIADWGKLDEVRSMSFPHATGGRVEVSAMAIDSGGHFTHESYWYGRLHRNAKCKVKITKGENLDGRPIVSKFSLVDINIQGRSLKHGVKLHFIGTDTGKDLLHGRLGVQTPGQGFIRFPVGLPREYFEQLTAEVRLQVKTQFGEKFRWVKRRPRNEALDCAVMAIWLKHELRIDRYTELQWLQLEEAINPPIRGLFDQVPQAVAIVEAAPVPAAAPEVSEAPRRKASMGSEGWSGRL